MEHDPTAPVVVSVQPEGTIVLPVRVVQRMGFQPGDRVRVRVSDAGVSRKLADRGVTDDEIDRIASQQLEERASVAQFLAAEGALATRDAFRRRVSAWSR